ncbi:hypothetical protein D9758_009754 [Tetrapyrgos nigripes]|uniref:Uncharacterized protein n=1 Tax=Tetrapyrgos nigripes TaxID=182062 RepID=A0A8H5LR42_9AGAR|nr:hypothetical protein D9758_009754 [Tetrapyrgos nigripes]
MPRLSLNDLLNPIPPHEQQIPFPNHPIQLQAPSVFQNEQQHVPQVTDTRATHPDNVKLTKKTTLARVYHYAQGTVLEDPETGHSTKSAVGHLFAMSLEDLDWKSPWNDFVYSRGEPKGIHTDDVTVPLLVSSATNVPVPCKLWHSTCQGIKICPQFDLYERTAPHSSATREQLQDRLREDRQLYLNAASPSRDVFERTSAYISSLVRNGCMSEAVEETFLGEVEAAARAKEMDHQKSLQRGYQRPPGKCEGRLGFSYAFDGRAVIKCEHYSALSNRDHFFDASISDGSYNLDYLEAVLCEDEDEIERIETEASAQGYGPRIECCTVTNFSSQRVYCPHAHRTADGGLLQQPKLQLVQCKSKFRQYVPLEEYRAECPFILIVCSGVHEHPIPLPLKTPTRVKSELYTLLGKLDVDLADMTPRRFLRHPVVKAYLVDRFPLLNSPTVSDLHISLANRSHLKVYIDAVKTQCFPEGTGWKGLAYLKQQQDSLLAPEEHYVRTMLTLPLDHFDGNTEDSFDDSDNDDFKGPVDPELGNVVRIAICMTREGSQRLASTQYLQSDIAFKRVIGYYEFELGALDRASNTYITFCRVYTTRKSAAVHSRILREIDDVLTTDVGRGLYFRHIHGTRSDDYGDGQFVLHWVVDEDRGQAKGIGLRLREIAQQFPNKHDLEEPHRLLTDLDPYDHLRRFLTLCTVHFSRNIRSSSVSEEVRNLMRSLLCIEHSDWDGTLNAICTLGGKTGIDWVNNKQSSCFAFPGLCWQKSLIPYDVWIARTMSTNPNEGGHHDVNREGVRNSLVGGTKKAMHFDHLKQQSLKINENLGIQESYSSKHLSRNMVKNIKRKNNFRIKKLAIADRRIETHNQKMLAASTRLLDAQNKTKDKRRQLQSTDPTSLAYVMARTGWEKAVSAEEKIQNAYEKIARDGQTLFRTGTGKVPISLPLSMSRN